MRMYHRQPAAFLTRHKHSNLYPFKNEANLHPFARLDENSPLFTSTEGNSVSKRLLHLHHPHQSPVKTSIRPLPFASTTALQFSFFHNIHNIKMSSSFSTGTNPGSDSSSLSMLATVAPLLKNVMTILVGLAAVIGGLLYAKQDSLLYYPEIGGIPRRPSQNPRRYRSPDEHQVPFEQCRIRCADGVRIHAWLMLRQAATSSSTAAKARMPTIVFFHGNAGNIGLRLPNALQMLQFLDCHVLLVEYRGYGDSDDATINEAGLKLDSEAALEFIRTHPQVDPNQIFIFGRSLGGSVAFHLALYAERRNIPIAGVIVENTFLSIAAMVDALMPYVAPFKSLILRIGWRSDQIVQHLTMPVLYLAGARDELVPHNHMMELYKKTKGSRYVKMHIIENGTHNESWLQGGTEYWAQFKDFMQQAIQTQPGNPSMSSSQPQPQSTATSSMEQSASSLSSDTGGTSSIPLMPSRLLGMVSETVRGKTEKGEPHKKEN